MSKNDGAMQMDIITDVSVECRDGPCGQSRYVILDPAKATVTHVVVGGPNTFARTHLVPIDKVAEGLPELIRLKCTRTELNALPQFSEYEYAGLQRPYPTYMPSEFWMGPLVAYWPLLRPQENQHMPEGELSIRRGARVDATDGRVGSVDGFLVEPVSGHLTHLVLREGHFWGHQDVTIPVAAIDRIDQDVVQLKIGRAQVSTLTLFQPESKGAELRDVAISRSSDPAAGDEDSLGFIQNRVADLASSDRRIREGARRSLVTMGIPAVSPLAVALTHEDPQVRWEAAKALQQIADPAIAPAPWSGR
jgi:hypothetical protein